MCSGFSFEVFLMPTNCGCLLISGAIQPLRSIGPIGYFFVWENPLSVYLPFSPWPFSLNITCMTDDTDRKYYNWLWQNWFIRLFGQLQYTPGPKKCHNTRELPQRHIFLIIASLFTHDRDRQIKQNISLVTRMVPSATWQKKLFWAHVCICNNSI